MIFLSCRRSITNEACACLEEIVEDVGTACFRLDRTFLLFCSNFWSDCLT